jgi:hypothetical protein
MTRPLNDAPDVAPHTGPRGSPAIQDLGALVEAVQDAQVTGLDGLLEEGHWKRGAVASAALLEETPGADAAVVFLFALLHDAMRLHDGYDPAHGWRATWLSTTRTPG